MVPRIQATLCDYTGALCALEPDVALKEGIFLFFLVFNAFVVGTIPKCASGPCVS